MMIHIHVALECRLQGVPLQYILGGLFGNNSSIWKHLTRMNSGIFIIKKPLAELISAYLTLPIGLFIFSKYGIDQPYLTRIHNPEGYMSPNADNDEEFDIYYYAKDHLGNIREVYKALPNQQFALVQQTEYYHSGLPWANATNSDLQPYKYAGTEFVEMHGLDEYDNHARWYYPAIMRTTTMDPFCEKYYATSPYACCNKNIK